MKKSIKQCSKLRKSIDPEINEKLLKQPRALLVPHVGTHTTETLAKTETWAMENARRAITGQTLLSTVPEHQHFC